MADVFKIARIALDVPLPRCFDYLLDGVTKSDIGKRVKISFANREKVGVIVDCVNETDVPTAKLKTVESVLDAEPLLTEDVLSLLRFCSQYYQYPLGATLFTAIPSRLRQVNAFKPDVSVYYQLNHDGMTALASLKKSAKAQLLLRDRLLQPAGKDELKWLASTANNIIKKWLEAGWLDEVAVPASQAMIVGEKPLLTHEQKAAIEQIAFNGFQTALLFGVTGSGKTEVYLQLVEKALQQKKQVLVLVPEINLTPQLFQRFAKRFPSIRIAALHSNVSDAERASEWLAAKRGDREIVLGTRLSVFAPLPHLGLIIVDEEHDAAYKQQDSLRYSAKHVAVVRAKQANVPIVLGSATPSLEMWSQAIEGKFDLLPMTRRAVDAAVLPTIGIVDTRKRYAEDGLSAELLAAIGDRLHRKEQSLVFINRRGFSPVVFCDACGWQAGCQRCSARLVLHRAQRRLICHHCGWGLPAMSACPDCGNQDLKPIGAGTQRLEEALETHFPNARVLRVDRDAMRLKGSWEAAQAQIMDGEADILIGTQMLAKGHDFPLLTLVGVINADVSLHSADFRATEKLFAQLMQVSGRAGRAGLPGQVLIQTGFPDHPVFEYLTRHDFQGFAEQLLTERQLCEFPPYSFQAILRAEASRVELALEWLQAAKSLGLRDGARWLDQVEVFDPVPALMVKVDQKERAQLLFQSKSRVTLQKFLSEWSYLLYDMPLKGGHWTLEVDPIDI
ncbi:primosomal protein N' [Leeia sp. TBRC 13508]|uniref:Replication restart protein PriA n=1 Tax=Leeia speluncae TaxID=2884804 RepID=A0ABS8D5K7_9NEIS|nr:primosomal protein N' [Leeia speluncae]MCB6183456.1 primosomal protein N' [Leeia speluncae]